MKKYKLVFTFGCATYNANNVVIVNCNDSAKARQYVYYKYGQDSVAFDYHYDEDSLKNDCEWQDGLFEEVKDSYNYGKDVIKGFNYSIIEEITLEGSNEKNKNNKRR